MIAPEILAVRREPTPGPRPARPPRRALVLGAGAARGAYEVGVLSYLFERIWRRPGPGPFRILSGTSWGAIHTCALAAYAGEPAIAVAGLLDRWRRMELGEILDLDVRGLLRLARRFAGGAPRDALSPSGAASLGHLERLVGAIPFDLIHDHITAGRLDAVAVATTHIGLGRAVVFVDGAGEMAAGGGGTSLRPAHLTAEHVLASAAIPMLFPPVEIDGALYCDGGLREHVPLAPACRLGAESILVISHRCASADALLTARRERASASPVYLLGKALDALLGDRIDEELERLAERNALLAAGQDRYGAGFAGELNRHLAPAQALRPIAVGLVRASQEIGLLAADFVASRAFARRAHGPAARLLRTLADAEGGAETDLVSYLLFDGAFASQLIDLGREDARRAEDALATLLDDQPVVQEAGA